MNQNIAPIGQQAVVTIGIANRYRSDPGLPRGHEPVTIGDSSPGREILELGDLADEMHHRLLGELFRIRTAGQPAIEANPGPHQVAPGKSTAVNPRTVGNMAIAGT